MTTEQHINFTADNNRRSNFGKAVLAIASVKANVMHTKIQNKKSRASLLLLRLRTKILYLKLGLC